jgi:exonuclease III
MSTVTLKLTQSKLTLFSIYRPPFSRAKSLDTASFSQFLKDFSTLISSASTTLHEFLMIGDLNIHADDLTKSTAVQFMSLPDHTIILTQHVIHLHRQIIFLLFILSISYLLLHYLLYALYSFNTLYQCT